MNMFNDKISQELINAAQEVYKNSPLGKSQLSPYMKDAAANIQDDVTVAKTADTQNKLIKTSMLNAAKETNFSLTPEASLEFEKLAKGGNK